jgi:hypothetical protein
MAWTKASERRPTEADAEYGWLLWRVRKDEPPFMSRWNVQFETYEWHPIIVPGDNEPAQEPELLQPGQDIWVRHFSGNEEKWQKKTLIRWKSYPVTASRSGESEIIWHEWSLTGPNKPPEPQYRPFKNAEEFWPFRNCWWRIKNAHEKRNQPPCSFTVDRYGGYRWTICFKNMELLEDIDGKMTPRPFGLEVTNET